MKKYEFRGKRIDNGEWGYGDLIQLNDGRRFIVNNKFGACFDNKGNFINTEAPFVCEVIPETVGQYTGLKDKNDKKIYKGDAIEITRKCVFETGIVIFEEGCFFIKSKEILLPLYEAGINFNLKIIGNIHGNPELLGGE